MDRVIGVTYIKLKEFQEIAKGRTVDFPLIALSGPSGCGKTMYAKMLVDRLKDDFELVLPKIEVGGFFREQAAKRGMTAKEFGEFLKTDKKLMNETEMTIDKNCLMTALEKPGIYVGRLTIYSIGEICYKIFLDADVDLTAKRIRADPNRDETKRGLNLAQIKAEIIKRDKDNIDRYKEVYGIEYMRDVPPVADIRVKNNTYPDTVFRNFYEPLTKWMEKKGFVKPKNGGAGVV